MRANPHTHFSANENTLSSRAFIILTLIFLGLACAIARAQTREDFEKVSYDYGQRDVAAAESFLHGGPDWFVDMLSTEHFSFFGRTSFFHRYTPRDLVTASDSSTSNTGATVEDPGVRYTPFDLTLVSGSYGATIGISKITQTTSFAGTNTNAVWTGGGGDDFWGTSANWENNANPAGDSSQAVVIHFAGTNRLTPNNNYGAYTQFKQILFDSGAGQFTLNGNTVKLYNWGDTAKIENNSSNTQTVSFNTGGVGIDFVGSGEINPLQGDLIINSGIITDGGGTSTVNVYGSGHLVRFNGIIANGGATTAFSLNDNNVVVFNAANTYTGDTLINSGEVRFTSTGSAARSTIRLGGLGANSPSSTLSLGGFFGDNNAVDLASTLVVRPSASGTQGTRLLRSLATSATNTYSGSIFLDANLTVESATGGTLLFQNGAIDVKARTLTIDDLSGNVNTRGNVIINEVLGSSSAAGGSLVKNGSNTLILQGTSNTYTGTDTSQLNVNGTQIGGGVLGIYGDGSLGKTPDGHYNNIQFTGSATLQDTANAISLAATRDIKIANGVTATLDSNGNTFTVNGIINGSGGNLAKAGAGTLVLNGANTFTGTTTISANSGTLKANAAGALGGTSGITINGGGTLLLANSGTNDRINDAATVTLNGGTFNTGGLSEHGITNNTAGVGALSLQSSSIIDMGSLSSILAFANSASQAGTWTGTLSIWNWSGNPTTGGGLDQLFFGNNSTGLLANQLADIQFYSGAGTGAFAPGAVILLDGEVVPASVPEPGTWAVGLFACGGLLLAYRRRTAAARAVLA